MPSNATNKWTNYQSSECGCHHISVRATGQPKICYFGQPFAITVYHEHVEGFQIAMDHRGIHVVEDLHPSGDV